MDDDAQARLLEQMLDPVTRCFTPDVARRLVELRASPAAQARIAELAEKCNEGELSAAERDEYEAYVAAGNLIAILQAKARRLLSEQTAA